MSQELDIQKAIASMTDDWIPAVDIYVYMYKQIPSLVNFISRYRPEVIDFLMESKTRPEAQNPISIKPQDTKGDFYIPISDQVVLECKEELKYDSKSNEEHRTKVYSITCLAPYGMVQLATEKWMKAIEQFKIDESKDVKCSVITKGLGGRLSLDDFDVNEPKIDIALNYPDFPDYEQFMLELAISQKGMYLFYGEPGTGKTTLIRKIISDMNNLKKQVIYIPPNLVNMISQPDFLKFMLKNLDSVLLIEDAEKVLMKREFNGSLDGIHNILNMSDGLLSDAMGCRIICTFNTDIENIDKALIRKGRMSLVHEFRPLSKDNAIKLAVHLGMERQKAIDTIKESMTLADIYLLDKKGYKKPPVEVGFRSKRA